MIQMVDGDRCLDAIKIHRARTRRGLPSPSPWLLNTLTEVDQAQTTRLPGYQATRLPATNQGFQSAQACDGVYGLSGI